jgi:hypothetical protein
MSIEVSIHSASGIAILNLEAPRIFLRQIRRITGDGSLFPRVNRSHLAELSREVWCVDGTCGEIHGSNCPFNVLKQAVEKDGECQIVLM